MAKTETEHPRIRLRTWRGGLTLRQASALVHIDPATLGKIEDGVYEPGEALCWRIQEATKIPLTDWPPLTVKPKKKGRAA